MADLNHVSMELFPPRTATMYLERWVHSKKVFKCFSALSLSKNPKPHQTKPPNLSKRTLRKEPKPMIKKKSLLSFFSSLYDLLLRTGETMKSRTITCKTSLFSGVNNFAFPGQRLVPRWCGSRGALLSLVVTARSLPDSKQNHPGNIASFQESSVTRVPADENSFAF